MREQHEQERKHREFERYVAEQQLYLHSRTKKRRELIQEIEAGAIENRTSVYHIDQETRQLLTKNDLNADKFTRCSGNQLQHYIHQDLISVLKAASNCYVQYAINSDNQTLCQTIALFADAGCDYNNVNDVLKASVLADWCWGAVNVLQKVGRGITFGIVKTSQIMQASVQAVVQGFVNTGNMLLHPKDFFDDLCKAVKGLAQCSAKVIVHVVNIDYHLEHDSVEGHAYFKQFADTALEVSQKLKQQVENATIEGVVSKSATIITEAALQCKISNQLGILFCNACIEAQKIASVTVNELLPATEVLVATAEGIEVAIAKETLPLLKNEIEVVKWSVKEYEAHNVAQYFKLWRELTYEQITSVVKVTRHGLQRLLERGFTPEEIIDCLTKPTILRIQNDGAKVYIKEIANKKYNFIVINETRGEVITAIPRMREKAILAQSKNYGWEL